MSIKKAEIPFKKCQYFRCKIIIYQPVKRQEKNQAKGQLKVALYLKDLVARSVNQYEYRALVVKSHQEVTIIFLMNTEPWLLRAIKKTFEFQYRTFVAKHLLNLTEFQCKWMDFISDHRLQKLGENKQHGFRGQVRIRSKACQWPF